MYATRFVRSNTALERSHSATHAAHHSGSTRTPSPRSYTPSKLPPANQHTATAAPMLLIKSAISRDLSGYVTLRPQEDEDIWHAYNLIQQGDQLRGSAIR